MTENEPGTVCMGCTPANGSVAIEELLAYKIQLHGLELSLPAD